MTPVVEKALYEAVMAALTKMGKAGFRQTSFFMSSHGMTASERKAA